MALTNARIRWAVLLVALFLLILFIAAIGIFVHAALLPAALNHHHDFVLNHHHAVLALNHHH